MTEPQWLWLCQTVVLCLAVCSSYGQQMDCNSLRKIYSDKGWNINDLPKKTVSGSNLLVCSEKETCCTQNMESKLMFESKDELKSNLNSSFAPLNNLFESSTRDVNDNIEQSLKSSEEKLQEQFTRTFGILHIQNRDIYTELFKELGRYYKGATNEDVNDIMKTFYKSVFRSIYQMINQHKQFDSDYLSCVEDSMDLFKELTFYEMIEKHSRQVKSTLMMARTLVSGMTIGRDVIQHVMNVDIGYSCVKDFMRLTYCPKCQGLNTKPCKNVCVSNMQNCLSDYTSLDKDWNKYADALERLAGRVDGPFSYNSVFSSMGIKISDVIMTLQGNPYSFSQIEKECGDSNTRSRRAARNRSISSRRRSKSRGSRGRSSGKPSNRYSTYRSSSSKDEPVSDFYQKLKNMKNIDKFWSVLPEEMCEKYIAGSSQDNCWAENIVGRRRREAGTSELEHFLKFAIEDQLEEVKNTLDWVDRNIVP